MRALGISRHARVTDIRAGSSALPERPQKPRDLGAQRLHAHICTYESVRDARGVFCERIDTDPMESAQGPRMARSWPIEGISTGTVQSDTVYDVFDSYADSHGPGSTGGRTQHGTLNSVRSPPRNSTVVDSHPGLVKATTTR